MKFLIPTNFSILCPILVLACVRFSIISVPLYFRFSIPDISAICTPEVELPTLTLDSEQLTPLSGGHHPASGGQTDLPPVATIHMDPLQTDLYTVIQTSKHQHSNKPHLRILEQPKSNSLR